MKTPNSVDQGRKMRISFFGDIEFRSLVSLAHSESSRKVENRPVASPKVKRVNHNHSLKTKLAK